MMHPFLKGNQLQRNLIIGYGVNAATGIWIELELVL
jgi:hypothetical protein